jgi:hypothetical protein
VERADIHYIGPAAAGAHTGVLRPRAAAAVLARPASACCAAALLAALVYLNALNNPFVYDDHHTVVDNPSIARVSDIRAVVLGAVTRPLVNVSYAVDRALWGTAPFGFHATNVALHAASVALLFCVARGFGLRTLAAFSAAALLAVHPMMSEAVGYISGRSEVLCAALFMLALLCGSRWVKEPGHAGAYAAATVGFWLAALAAKETAAVFPFVFLVHDKLALRDDPVERRRRLRTIHLPLIGFAAAAGVARMAVFAGVEYARQVRVRWDYALVELDVVRRYVWLIVNPHGQTIFHSVAAPGPFDGRTLIAIATIAAAIILAVRVRATAWPATVGLLWFLLALTPSSAMALLDQGEPMAEHRVYLASCGLFLAAGVGIGRLGEWVDERAAPTRPGARLAFVGVPLALVVGALATMTIVRNAIWSDPVALWQESVNLAPSHYRPRLLLGEALQDAGRRRDALEEFRVAVRLRPAEPLGYVKVGQTLAETGQWQAAREQFTRALELDPSNVSARNSLHVLDDVERRFGIDAGRR